MQWTDIKITTLKEYEDICNLVGGEVCPLGIQIEDYSDLEQAVLEIARIDLIEQELIDKNRDKIIVHHYISPQHDAQEALLTIESRLSELGVKYTSEIEYVNQEDWETGWKAYYNPIDIGEKLAICPSWQEYQTDRIILKLDPGMAFGTGTHETTYLCLETLDSIDLKNKRVLDVGTGSGILGIASVLFGASEVDGVDIDPTSVKVADENSQLNNTQGAFNIKVGDLAQTATGTYDVVVANIVANAIIELSQGVPALLKKGGLYITSGIILERKDDVVNALEKNGFTILEIKEKNNWVCIKATI